MKEGILNKIVNAGGNGMLPDYLHRRVKPTNITTLILVFSIALPFVIISLIFVPPLAFIPAAGAVTGIGVLIANYYGYVRYSRLFISVLPVWQVMSYNAFLSGPLDEPVSSLYLVAISFILAPFVIFDIREKLFIGIATMLCALGILSFPFIKVWLNLDFDQSQVDSFVKLLETGWLSNVTAILAIVAAVGSILGLSVINRNAEKESEAMRREAVSQKEKLQIEKLQREEDLVKLREAQAVEQKRKWAAEGIASLSDILRGNSNEQELYDRVVAMVVKCLQANQGSLYVVNREDDQQGDVSIELVSCYAYSRKKHQEQSFLPGQGLLGQIYLEGEIVHLTDIPQNYVKITSGLGEATPTSLLIVPLKVNDVIEGMLEIASFKKFEQHEIDFLGKLGESIASFIQNNRVNVRTKLLLEQAQQQAEELKAQEEEMRQNMEELAATQEEMQRKEQEYQRVIHELESR